MSGLTEKSLVIKEKVGELIHLHWQLHEVNLSLSAKNANLEKQVSEINTLNNAAAEEVKALKEKCLKLNKEKEEFELLFKIAEEEKAALDLEDKESSISIALNAEKQRSLKVLEEKEALLKIQLEENESLKIELIKLSEEKVLLEKLNNKIKNESITISACQEQMAELSSALEKKELDFNLSINSLAEEKKYLEFTVKQLLNEKADSSKQIKESAEIANETVFEKQIEVLKFETEVVKEELKVQLDAFNNYP